MIEINLAPLDELEDPQWWLPDLVVFLGALFLSYYLIEGYKSSLQQSVDEIDAQTAEFEQNIRNIEPEIAAFKDLQEQISKLERKVKAIKNITVSKLAKYKTVLIMEHLQTLKPQGVWFESISEMTSARKIELTGYALDPVLVAQFISEIGYTNLQKADPTDIRTQIYFENIDLINMDSKPLSGAVGELQPNGYPYFKVTFYHRDRELNVANNTDVAH